jgi:hypothetical protein
MKTKTLLATSLVTLLVAGCGHMPRPDGKAASTAATGARCEANEPVCHITVRVRGCRVQVDPDWKRVARRPGGVQMLWTIRDSKGVTFARNGIEFKERFREKEGGLIFRPERTKLVGTTFAMHNSTAIGEFPYTVNVMERGERCEPHDPGVINQM